MDISYLIALVEAIVKSPSVEQYNIGITLDATRRRSQYWRGDKVREYDHFVLLEWMLSQSEALQMEECLFVNLTQDRQSITYTKYKHTIRDQKYRRGLGGRLPSNEDLYDLYIAWWEPK
jgi:hypothetical protein